MMIDFKPTYLYIKQHSITGKLYFGKTVRKDPVKYEGSGTHWKSHFKFHGKEHVETIWHCLFHDKESIKEFAIMCSAQWDIVKSDNWLNLIPEDGIGNGVKDMKHSIEAKLKIGLGHKDKPKSIEQRTKMSISSKGKSKSDEHCAHIKEKRALQVMKLKTWTLQDPHCNLIIIQRLKEFCKANHLGLSKLLNTQKTKIPVETGFSTGWQIIKFMKEEE